MADTMTPEQRHRCMAAVKGKDTKPELIVRKYLFSRGLRFRIQVRKLPGCPDIVLPKYRTVIFVNGCFWHGHEGCRLFRMPKSNIEFWERKISHNKARDISNTAVLELMGWRVIRIWECEIKTVSERQSRLERLYNEIVGITNYNLPSDQPVDFPTDFPSELPAAAEPEAPYGS